MTTQLIQIGTNGTFGNSATISSGRRGRRSAAAGPRMLAAFQTGLAVVLLALALFGMTAIGGATKADTTPQHHPVPGLDL
jgi:hypothetical protein